jgi:hypothetical protein
MLCSVRKNVALESGNYRKGLLSLILRHRDSVPVVFQIRIFWFLGFYNHSTVGQLSCNSSWLGVLLAGCAILNASIIYVVLCILSRALAAATVPQGSQTDMLSLCSSIVLHDDRDEVMPEQAKLAERYQSGNPAQLTFPVFAKGILLPSNLMH